MNNNRIELSKYRIEKSKASLLVSQSLAKQEYWADAANRSYYAIFHAMRAVLALDAFDSKKHSGIISYFQEHYIKTKIFESLFSNYIRSAFLVRNKSDYDDFYVVSKEDTEKQIQEAALFLDVIEKYLSKQWECGGD